MTIFILCEIISSTAQVMMEAYRHKTSMIMSSIGFKDYFEQSPDSEMIKALAHNPTDDLKQMQKVKEKIDKSFGHKKENTKEDTKKTDA